MSQLDEIDKFIGEALENITVAAKLIRTNDELDTDINLLPIGKATYALWEVRNTIYKIQPDLTPDFVNELSENKIQYEELSKTHELACSFEEDGQFKEALTAFEALLLKAKIGHFKRLAEAGLYRVSQKSE